MDRLEQVRRRAEAHQVARPRVVRQERHDHVERRVALGRRLVAGQPADADAVERQAAMNRGRLGPQVRLEAALDDPEQRLVRRACAPPATAPPSDASARSRRPRRPRDELGKTGWSKATAMSEPSASWTPIACSGVNRWIDPSRWLRNVTPSSSTTRRSPSETTWKPPESVRIGRSQPMNRCSPPSRAIRSWPGPQVQVVGVREDDRRAGLAEVVRVRAP